MFEKLSNFFNKMTKPEVKELASKDAAKERLHLVLMQDRANVSVDFLELMKQEIIDVIKKYIVVDENAIDVRLTNQEKEDGTSGAPSLYANIPIINIKNDVKAEKIKDGTLVYENGELGKNIVVEENVNNSIQKENSFKEFENAEKSSDKTNETDGMKVIELGEPKILVEETKVSENIVEENVSSTSDIVESEISDENNKEKDLDIPQIDDLSTITVELDEVEAESLEPILDFPDDEEDDDDDVTFDDLLKRAEEEEAIQNLNCNNEKNMDFSKENNNKKSVKTKKGAKHKKS